MKKYNVYGLGNALVDMEFEIDDAFLQKYKVDKGLMTLVDEDRQNLLMEAIDVSRTKLQSGGSAANSMISISQFGGKAFYSCKVAKDEMGDFYMKDLREAGVDSNIHNGDRKDGITGKCLVMITPDAERTMNTFLGITADFSPEELEEESIKDSEYLYIEGYLVASDTGYEAMVNAKKIAEQNNVKVALTFSDINMIKFFRERMDNVVGASVDLLFCNEEEAFEFTGKDNIEEAREELKKHARNFAITQGKNGAMIFDGDTFIDIEPYNVKAIDTNGAGDMFAGAFLYGITNGHSYAGSGKLASLASSKIVSQFGPRLKWHQAKDLLQEFH